MDNQGIKKKNGKRANYLIAAIFCAIGILTLSVLPPKSLSPLGQFQFKNLDKFVHAFMYAVLAFLWFRALPGVNNTILQSGLILLFVSIYGVLMEFAQLLVKGRSFEWEDMLSNIAGAFIGIVIAFWKKTSTE